MNLHRIACVLLALGCLMLSGCVLALNSLGTDKDIVFDEQLLGTWVQPLKEEDQKSAKTERRESWTFEKQHGKSYTLTIRQGDPDSPQGVFDAQLIKLEDKLYLQIQPDMEAFKKAYGKNAANLAGFYMIRGYFVYKVLEHGNRLKLAFWNMQELEKFLKDNPGVITWQEADDKCVFTAKTAELQKFYLNPKVDTLWQNEGDKFMVKAPDK